MELLAVGINHRTASIGLRETISFTPEQLVPALQDLKRQGIQEATILSTCNRTEIYLYGQIESAQVLLWLSQFHDADYAQLQAHVYCHTSVDALSHIIRVAAGLDSLVLGEPQIFGQVKTAYAAAQQAGTIHGVLGRMFQHVFSAAKTIRTQTAIGASPVSVASAAVQLAQRIFTDLHDNTALLIGAGETVELVAQHLKERNIGRLIIANRTIERAIALAEKYQGEAVVLADIPFCLNQADIIIAATASQLPLLGKGAVERALKKRRHRPIFMVDIAVPRDIEPEVGDLADAYLYTVDDLHTVVEDNVRSRQQAAVEAEKLVHIWADDFFALMRSLDAVDMVRAYRTQAETIHAQELQKALRLLERGHAPENILKQLAHSLTNKLIHIPSVQLRKAGQNGETEKLEWAQELLLAPSSVGSPEPEKA